jgi:hypothetical protein
VLESLAEVRGYLAQADKRGLSASLCYASDSFLRPARLLLTIHTQISATEVLFEGVPTTGGARFGARTTMATATDRTRAVGAHGRLTTSEQGRLA